MKIVAIALFIMSVACFGVPAMADSAEKIVSAKTAQATSEAIPMPDNSAEMPLDEKIGAGTSVRLAAEGPVGYDDNTGMMDVVPSDFEGDIED